ncbi:MAG TPA: molybdate ABC transporter substrate-binding protein, partial [Pyrinomonadaceae bacterium]
LQVAISSTRISLLLILSGLLFFVQSCNSNRSIELKPTEITVAAASDLTPAFEELGKDFQTSKNIKVIFNFGSSGMLARQIEHGAPMDIFASANVDYVTQLEQKGLTIPGTKKLYGRGRITLWTLKDSSIQIEKITDLTRAEVKRVAIANPEHAPYGMAAREALERSGIWEDVKSKLVYGENIRQTLQYAQTGNVEVAIVALSLSMQSDGRWVLVPEQLHKPLDQGLAVIKGAKNEQAAREFADFILGPQGQAIMKKYGFTLPEVK